MKLWIAAALATVLLVAGVVREPHAGLGAYLAAYAFVSSIALGALTLAMIGRLTGARWYARSARRATEAIVSTLPLLAVLFLPIAFGLEHIYPWRWRVDESRAAFFQPWFFMLRSGVYLACWSALALALPCDPVRVSAIGLPVVALTASFAAFDWFMSLEPGFASAIYGVYVWSGGFLAVLALVVLSTPSPALPHFVGEGVWGQLVLTAAIFWGYVAYAQGFIIWIAGLPRETSWYEHRVAGAWGYVLLAVVAAKFVVPFLALLPYSWKRRPRVLEAVAVLVLLGHALDALWLVGPAVHGAFAPSVLDGAAFVALACFLLAAASEQPEGVPA